MFYILFALVGFHVSLLATLLGFFRKVQCANLVTGRFGLGRIICDAYAIFSASLTALRQYCRNLAARPSVSLTCQQAICRC